MVQTNLGPSPIGSLQGISSAAFRELAWGLRSVRADQARRRARAARIRDPGARADALTALVVKRSVTNGAAFFWTVPRHRSEAFHRVLLALQTLANYVDVISEREGRERGAAPRPWARAIEDAVSPGEVDRRPDGLADDGYLEALVAECRAGCLALPGFGSLGSIVQREGGFTCAFDVEHDPDAARRWTRLEQLVRSRFPAGGDLSWFEQTAGATSMLTVFAPLALAVDGRTGRAELEATVDVYRVVGALGALLDHYADRRVDARTGGNNYLDLYGSADAATERLGTLIERSLAGVRTLPDGDRHAVLVACMVAMFLTSASVDRAPGTRTLLARAGPLTRALVPPLALWRLAHRVPDG